MQLDPIIWTPSSIEKQSCLEMNAVVMSQDVAYSHLHNDSIHTTGKQRTADCPYICTRECCWHDRYWKVPAGYPRCEDWKRLETDSQSEKPIISKLWNELHNLSFTFKDYKLCIKHAKLERMKTQAILKSLQSLGLRLRNSKQERKASKRHQTRSLLCALYRPNQAPSFLYR